ncbi:hypothetical protein SUGI_0036660 [Cryptomeria japonica]|uniref:DNA replication licensing factor MCM4 n=1 Tax=Cryptomeria japonica TaxID=3369 RepID=UPI002408CD45|nr:DNA replication licensing factor MCM4 [Cryptomeria japonica]GLJ06335.1 hypothetical protein SUGI_0036660 [Cryptomeria japonica]
MDSTSSPIAPREGHSSRESSPVRRRSSRRRSGSVSSGYTTPLDFGTPATAKGTPSYVNYRNDISSSSTGRRQRQPVTPSSGGDATEMPQSSEGDLDGNPPMLVWGTNISVQDVNQAVQRFLRNFRDDPSDLEGKYMRLLEQTMEVEGDSLNIDAMNIFEYDEDLYGKMVRYPLEVLAIFDIVLMDVAVHLKPLWEKHIQARIFNLRDTVNMRELNPSDIEKMVSVKGMIIRCSSIIPEIKEAFFRCLVCGYAPAPVPVDRGRIDEPTRCARPECAAMNSLTLMHNRCRFADKQIVRLQETPDAIPEGETPHTVSLLMHDKLVDAAKPGDRVEVTGIFRAMTVRVGPNQRVVKSLFKTYIDCLHLKKADKTRLRAEDPMERDANSDSFASFQEGDMSPADYEAKIEKLKELSRLPDIYERLTRSLAPSIWELEDVKKGLLCQLFGGTAVKLASGATFRGDINILLVGDPGTSKSQLLQYVHKLAPRGIYTSGRGSSAVGLTAYVSKDPETGETVLESGALVLSDRGICCIDEFDKMSDNARSMLHEVMEQQTVSIAKAGIIASLNARTSVLACANPSGSRYNPRLSVIDNIQLPPTLLSRFDLIYLVLDKADEQTDRRLARHLVALHYDEPEDQTLDALDLPTLTSYITYARQHIHPKISDEAAEDLIRGYVEMRRKGNFPGSSKKVITATPRQIESLIRISEALARIRFSEWVERCDVAEAFRLLEVALQQSATDHSTGTIDMDLINTGVSASERIRRANLVSSVRILIMEKMQAGGPSTRITELMEEMHKQGSKEVNLNDIRNAIGNLVSEGFVTIHGDNVKRT